MMALYIKRNGSDIKSDRERRAAIREQIRLELSRGGEDRDDYLANLRERILVYERRYERSSESMMKDLCEGKIKETGDISMWASVWQTLKRLEEKTPTTGTR